MSDASGRGWDFSAATATPAGGLAAPSPPPPQLPPPPPTAAVGGGDRPQPPRHPGDLVRTFIRGIGQTLITFGLVLLLFVVYEVWVSNFFAHRKQTKVHNEYVQAIKHGQDPLHGEDRLNLPSGKQVIIAVGEGFANLYIPRFGKDYAQTIVQGIDDASLELGPGHYVDSGLPGQIGNFAIAGHRVGKGEPFLNLDQLRPGDSVVVQTAKNWYVYRVLGDSKKYDAALKITDKDQRNQAITAALQTPDAEGVVGREIVSPSAVEVIEPVPDHAGKTPTRALLTMTTCHPKYSANQRMVIHAVLDRAVPNAGNGAPKELVGGKL
jgi:sortase A